MEWSKEKTLRLIELLQMNANLWNTSHSDTRREKQKRKEELRFIAGLLGISVPDVAKKVQHLRTQYNREWVRETRVNAEDPHDRYISNWYAYEYLHFLKDTDKPHRILQSVDTTEMNATQSHIVNSVTDCKHDNDVPLQKVARLEGINSMQPETVYPNPNTERDEFTVFGEYIANELRTLKSEKNLLVAKKKIQDVIFEVKMEMIHEPKPQTSTVLNIETHTSDQPNSLQSTKVYTTPVMSTITHLTPLTPHSPHRDVSEIIINSGCHYSNFKLEVP